MYIPLNEYFGEALETMPEPQYYSQDGIHPNENGAIFYREIIRRGYRKYSIKNLQIYLRYWERKRNETIKYCYCWRR